MIVNYRPQRGLSPNTHTHCRIHRSKPTWLTAVPGFCRIAIISSLPSSHSTSVFKLLSTVYTRQRWIETLRMLRSIPHTTFTVKWTVFLYITSYMSASAKKIGRSLSCSITLSLGRLKCLEDFSSRYQRSQLKLEKFDRYFPGFLSWLGAHPKVPLGERWILFPHNKVGIWEAISRTGNPWPAAIRQLLSQAVILEPGKINQGPDSVSVRADLAMLVNTSISGFYGKSARKSCLIIHSHHYRQA